ncbi:Protopine 6-monooxygenase [Seminavis robusta]|uniref:Protopine 6-monooxygenase n=1 Tax=Seminavis robusta TaxID=568900 RepID=A0A9N8H7I5_9STRA|nr:Protopine 6-monooxygenase [Seminavis robusta]|eukprot:Sro180_g078880.1 Protopine 6-monooxygenase (444) ;mRNA; r:83812-85302
MDLLESFLQKTAPVAASEELGLAGTQTCERRLNGTPFILTKDPKIANYVFNDGKARTNYCLRPGEDRGLQKLHMFENGLIWNNDTPKWKKIRGCFQKALGANALKHASCIIQKEAEPTLTAHMEKADGKEGIDLLAICRRLTFRASLGAFFGVDSTEFAGLKVDEAAFIDAIVQYFKAWEYFLIRPEQHWDKSLAKKHSQAVSSLKGHVQNLLKAIEMRDASLTPSQKGSKRKLFVESLREVCVKEPECEELLLQSSLEMLLAGTDTSSVTAYYTLLALAGDKALQHDLREELHNSNEEALLRSIVDESLRFKPVGPVVLRQACQDDPNFPAGPVKKGTGILVHLAEMNLDEEVWKEPRKFDPRRFLVPGEHKSVFFPFGEGPKGCVGMHLGRREVNSIVATVILQYDLEIVGSETLSSLETHWDIANQPDDPTRIRLSPVAD